MKGYQGNRTASGCVVTVHEQHQDERHDTLADAHPLQPRHDLRNHSPDGFEWGYGGSGPAQLALALCADATGDDELALRVYQEWKDRIVRWLKSDPWMVTQTFVVDVVKMIVEDEKKTPVESKAVH